MIAVLQTAYGIFSVITDICFIILVARAMYRWRDTQRFCTDLGIAIAEVIKKHNGKSITPVVLGLTT